MPGSNTPNETPGLKGEVVKTPLVVNVPSTVARKEKKSSSWGRLVDMVTPRVHGTKRLDGKPSGIHPVKVPVSKCDSAEKRKVETVDPRIDSADTARAVYSDKDSDAGSTTVVDETSESRHSDAGSWMKETDASKEKGCVVPRES